MTDESSPAAAGAPTWASYLAHGAVRHDLFGLPVATTSAACAAEVAAFQHNVLAYGSDWASGSRAADADPGCALAQLMAADGAVAEEDMAAATAALAEAERLVGAAGAGVPSRERRYADAYSAWLGGDAAAAGELFELLARDYPRDLFALKRAQLCYFILGKADRMLACAQRPIVLRNNAGREYFHGMLAFALEQVGDLDAALEHGLRGTDIRGDDAWSQHAVAHALYFQGELRRGADWLSAPERSEQWRPLCSFMRTHNWWHVALFHLDMGALDVVAGLYDREVWGVDVKNAEDQFGGLGMLAKWSLRLQQLRRAQEAGYDGPLGMSREPDGTNEAALASRWADVLAQARARATAAPCPIYDVVLAYGLAVCSRGGAADGEANAKALDAATAHVREVVEGMPPDKRESLGRVWLGAHLGMSALGRGDAEEAAAQLGAVLDGEAMLSGSSEQRAVVTEAYVEALLLSGAYAKAHEQLDRIGRDFVPAMQLLRAEAARGLGKPEEAARALRDAASLFSKYSSAE